MTDAGSLRPLDAEALRVPTTPAEQAALREQLWGAVPKPLTLRMPRHTIVFQLDPQGRALGTGPHEWGPLRVELGLGPSGNVTIDTGANAVTGQALDTKTLLDLAEAVQDALAADLTVGPLVGALRAVGHQRLPGRDGQGQDSPEWPDDAAVTEAALTRLRDAMATTGDDRDVETLKAALTLARTERDDARAWARAVHHQAWDGSHVPANYPSWLTDPA
ncbi:hypothetical protein GCM10009867_17210 [Pedococcus aerophilus]|uniref:Uncharacterized protein n=1 Tax=Pedococcus aerophilus TaxID=436356 RepID=A0ABP6H1G1_9MICO